MTAPSTLPTLDDYDPLVDLRAIAECDKSLSLLRETVDSVAGRRREAEARLAEYASQSGRVVADKQIGYRVRPVSRQAKVSVLDETAVINAIRATGEPALWQALVREDPVLDRRTALKYAKAGTLPANVLEHFQTIPARTEYVVEAIPSTRSEAPEKGVHDETEIA